MAAGRATIEILAEYKSLKAATADITSNLRQVGAAAAAMGAAITAAFTATIISAIRLADEVDNVSKRLNITIKSAQELKFIAEQNGSSLEKMGSAVLKLDQELGKAMLGVSGAGDAFKKLGLDVNNLSALLRTDAVKGMTMVVDALNKVENQSLKAALANEIFGKQLGGEVLQALQGGSEGVRELTTKLEEMGGVNRTTSIASLAELDDVLGQVKTAFRILAVEVAEIFRPAIKAVVGVIIDLIYLFRLLPKPIQEIIIGIGVAVAIFLVFAGAVALAAAAMSGLYAACVGIVALTGPLGWGLIAGSVAAIALAGGALLAAKQMKNAKEEAQALREEAEKAGAPKIGDSIDKSLVGSSGSRNSFSSVIESGSDMWNRIAVALQSDSDNEPIDRNTEAIDRNTAAVEKLTRATEQPKNEIMSAGPGAAGVFMPGFTH